MITISKHLHQWTKNDYHNYSQKILTLVQKYIITMITVRKSSHWYTKYIITMITVRESSHWYTKCIINMITYRESSHWYTKYIITMITVREVLHSRTKNNDIHWCKTFLYWCKKYDHHDYSRLILTQVH